MKRIMVSVGVVALGAAAIQNCNAQGDGGKAWSISAALRGFYDDNVNTGPSGTEIDTFGFEISPSLGYELPLEQTAISLAYTFAYKYYDESPRPGTSDHDDMTHTIAARLLHSFNETTTLSIRDSFVIGQEPDVLGYDSFQRISGDNIRNYASIALNHQFTEVVGAEVGYNNSLFDYDHEGATIILGPMMVPVGVAASRSGVLDRVEHNAHLDGRWTLANNSVLIVGYRFGLGCYTGDEVIGVDGGALVSSSIRDYTSHYGYVGMEHTFRPDLVGNARVGVRYTDYDNTNETQTSPYAAASLRYSYARDSHLELGVSHDRSASDRVGPTGSSLDSDSTVLYGVINHAITPNLTGSLMGQFQNNNYNGGTLDNENEQFYMMNVALRYQFTPNIAGTVSYNYDNLDSDDNSRSFDRNRVFLGAIFSY